MQLPDGEKDFFTCGCGDEHDSNPTLVGHTKEGPEPQSEKECEKCKHFNEDLEKPPCYNCYVCRYKCEWVEREDDDEPDNESGEMGRKNCSSCAEDMPY